MSRSHDQRVLSPLATLFREGAVGRLDDASLLGRFVAGRDEGAFSALVSRHGPMILRVCREVLRDEHNAHDAFQATFLVLARRAGSIRRAESLASWLHGVALRISACARADAARRRRHERAKAEAVRESRSPESRIEPDERTALHEEIRRLPARYRVAVVLCHLEGLTHEEAGHRLGCPVGTIRSRLARGRDRLRDRLTRRGLAPAALAFGAGLLTEPAHAAVPVALAEATARAAARFASGWASAAGTVPPAVSQLTRGALTTMFLNRLKLTASVLIGLGLAGTLALPQVRSARADDPAPEPRPDPHARFVSEAHLQNCTSCHVASAPVRLDTMPDFGAIGHTATPVHARLNTIARWLGAQTREEWRAGVTDPMISRENSHALAQRVEQLEQRLDDLQRRLDVSRGSPTTEGMVVGGSPATDPDLRVQGRKRIKPGDLDGRWLMTLPAGFMHRVALVEVEPGRYRLLPRTLNSSGLYELRGDRLVIAEPDDQRLTGFEWKFLNPNTMVLIEQPPPGRTGADYLGATMTRQVD